ncbi:hypothetical protein JCM19037_2249 [Geomicrobium sp. JCM 19037]|uniref:aspartate/glutamate racemase family protein n=1 Tax=Geomicrobium sp. JCM 19037 TaxID=1460634 RepID=UPI00045F35F5|nr:aspartate/glutamate racemase family protein [Geomicrobium sp. JCM 19037]GAK03891.1 hypothetical protein JCM19037_2249 [Geomicrobium sp. JCM 19037]
MKRLRIGLIHATMNSVSPILDAFTSYGEDVELVNFMDEGLIYELNETNEVTTRMIMRLTDLAGKAAESDVDAILFTCSSFTPYVSDIADLMPVPVLSSDQSMLERAVLESDNIYVIATIRAAGPTTERIIQQIAREKGRDVTVHVQVVTEAFAALQAGDVDRHDQHIRETIQSVSASNTVVLAQYSMARAVTNETTPYPNVLTGPSVSVEAIINLAKRGRSK